MLDKVAINVERIIDCCERDKEMIVQLFRNNLNVLNISEIMMTECAGWMLAMYLTGDPDIVDNNLKAVGAKLRELRETLPHLEISDKLDS